MRPPGRKFPTVAADGTFAVRVIFASSPGAPIQAVRDWLAAWIGANSDWHAFGSPRPFDAYFTAPPEADLGSTGELTVLLRGAGDEGEKRFWKDWYVRLSGALLSEFPAAGTVVRVVNVQAA